ncbi:unnamed protein product [Spirodela intermedia]|uniref:Kinesin-like protein n=1 Tax=Spirodela intermedia TaxID=51605 RepID=A0A7I8JPR2_SPIIN|nr:unnamed protein product [Spirodela intermedia]CAA6671422.1 unnamed protein product [Spirodela intermedia]
MPVTTRSQISGGGHESILRPPPALRRPPHPPEQEAAAAAAAAADPPPLPPSLMRNPHYALKEKMKALTQFYEQHQHQLASVRSLSSRPEKPAAAGHLISEKKRGGEGEDDGEVKKVAADLVMRENPLNVLPASSPAARKKPAAFHCTVESKENLQDRPTAFSCPKKEPPSAARKLSLGGGAAAAQSEPRVLRSRRISGELGTISEGGGGGSRIMVYVRLRPMAKKEKEAGSRSCVRIVNRREVYLTELTSDTDYLRLKRLRGRHFRFDASFPESTSQQDVYATTEERIGVLLRRHGAGKTYTMLGTVEKPGVMVLAIKDLFSKIRQRSYDGNHLVHLSYLEVYNETVRDLLSPGRPLVLREDKQGIMAAGLTQYRAYSTDEVMALLQQGNQNRTTEPTRVNETSSRSHAILQVVAEVGKLSLIDLAGSERALATDQRSQRSLEGANINRSLLALSSCINALVEGRRLPRRPLQHRHDRQHQPSNLSFGETQNTLHWADRAKEIRTKACAENGEEALPVPETETDQAKLLLELQRENSDLRQQLAREKQKLVNLQAQSMAASAAPPSPGGSSLLSPPPSTPRRPKRSLLSGTCFRTPESKKKRGAEEAAAIAVKELQQRVKTLETELERMKKQHTLQIKQKDEFIRDLVTRKNITRPLEIGEGGRERSIVTRASLRKAERSTAAAAAGELKSPSHRFLSPAPTAKKRSFWDITAANSPSVLSINGRKLKSYIAAGEATPLVAAPPSLLLQPGFSRQRLASVKK